MKSRSDHHHLALVVVHTLNLDYLDREIKRANNKIAKLWMYFNYSCNVLEFSNLGRRSYIAHDLHLNSPEKNLVFSKILDFINNDLSCQEKTVFGTEPSLFKMVILETLEETGIGLN